MEIECFNWSTEQSIVLLNSDIFKMGRILQFLWYAWSCIVRSLVGTYLLWKSVLTPTWSLKTIQFDDGLMFATMKYDAGSWPALSGGSIVHTPSVDGQDFTNQVSWIAWKSRSRNTWAHVGVAEDTFLPVVKHDNAIHISLRLRYAFCWPDYFEINIFQLACQLPYSFLHA